MLIMGTVSYAKRAIFRLSYRLCLAFCQAGRWTAREKPEIVSNLIFGLPGCSYGDDCRVLGFVIRRGHVAIEKHEVIGSTVLRAVKASVCLGCSDRVGLVNWSRCSGALRASAMSSITAHSSCALLRTTVPVAPKVGRCLAGLVALHSDLTSVPQGVEYQVCRSCTTKVPSCLLPWPRLCRLLRRLWCQL